MNNASNSNLATRQESTALDIDLDHISAGLTKIRQFQSLVRKQLVKGHDFDVIAGTQRPSLLKPGAEKLAKLLSLADSYIVEQQTEDWERGFFHYRVTCELRSIRTGDLIAQGLGSCNSKESKFRFRWCFSSEIPEGVDKKSLHNKTITTRRGNRAVMYRVENDDTFSLNNTILKMAKKRALVDAVLSAGRLSDVFGQGDGGGNGDDDAELSLVERRHQMLTYFESKGVTQQQVFDLVGVGKIQQITLKHLSELKQIAGNIRDGVASVEDFFGNGDDQSESRKNDEHPPIDAETPEAIDKGGLVDEIKSALAERFTDDSLETEASRLKLLKDVFGKTVWKEIEQLPLEVLQAGLKMILDKEDEKKL